MNTNDIADYITDQLEGLDICLDKFVGRKCDDEEFSCGRPVSDPTEVYCKRCGAPLSRVRCITTKQLMRNLVKKAMRNQGLK